MKKIYLLLSLLAFSTISQAQSVKLKFKQIEGGVPGQILMAGTNGTGIWVDADSLKVQPDWNETNPASPAYIKNKPNVIIGVADEIEKLKKLLNEGAITQKEYDKQKKKLLKG